VTGFNINVSDDPFNELELLLVFYVEAIPIRTVFIFLRVC
jgi:hypothetical protein